jgi:hypothetical protein
MCFFDLQSYFRFCYIDDEACSEDDMKKKLCSNLMKCLWFDGFSRSVRIRENALDEITVHIGNNINELTTQPFSDNEEQALSDFKIEANQSVICMIGLHRSDESNLSEADRSLRQSLSNFIYNHDGTIHPPIPVFSQINPRILINSSSTLYCQREIILLKKMPFLILQYENVLKRHV